MNSMILLTLVAFLGCALAGNPEDVTKATSIYDFSATDIMGNEISMDKYKGNVLLIVNVASKCGLTNKNYEQLNALNSMYMEKGLRILAFPCNQFMGQEPGSNEEIAKFAMDKGVKFDMFSKIDVNGDNAHPLYKFLKYKQPGTGETSDIEWNFAKFIVDKSGQVVERHPPMKDPLDLKAIIEKYL
ncbi:glutathione peroxidase-like [Anthonomus grandis grandis]|uniref:glutathione peroxidase-like n=1 Tax=Anthonomus grandis grandis TaxID=2921223 RepID=UPI002166837E|nr:glutathione peroxidase-like [Anthonomus grandis grandis]XP_050303359.1 glutathione peroxidase-like [Anthonomus grandis grandis]XP_050303360.1 glutathione peroxidase-like [Anthonomus grandis grandis]XP_050315492.1 glutathione peroxidase-like [Anthonomus grandis grandis]XP_050315493.1 glutathione peroxidase-like [Anthonomus grandis grandis]XP_050315494.1 glutathione peroxidase-like [Anthonomus grandis grandis]